MSTNQIPETGAGQPPAPDYENKRQLAARLGVSIRTIDNLLTRGLPHCKLTRRLVGFHALPWTNGWPSGKSAAPD